MYVFGRNVNARMGFVFFNALLGYV